MKYITVEAKEYKDYTEYKYNNKIIRFDNTWECVYNTKHKKEYSFRCTIDDWNFEVKFFNRLNK